MSSLRFGEIGGGNLAVGYRLMVPGGVRSSTTGARRGWEVAES
jgi:hypothetical protein